jgi:hypothetical protein
MRSDLDAAVRRFLEAGGQIQEVPIISNRDTRYQTAGFWEQKPDDACARRAEAQSRPDYLRNVAAIRRKSA